MASRALEAEEKTIRELTADMRSVTVTFILLDRLREPRTTDTGSVLHLWLVADETGAIDLALYDSHGDAFRGGDIVRLANGHCKLHYNKVQLGVGKHGKPRRVGELTMRYSEVPYMSVPLKPGTPEQQMEQAQAMKQQQLEQMQQAHAAKQQQLEQQRHQRQGDQPTGTAAAAPFLAAGGGPRPVQLDRHAARAAAPAQELPTSPSAKRPKN
eukprot:1512981-Prymnesium_polylepis.1